MSERLTNEPVTQRAQGGCRRMWAAAVLVLAIGTWLASPWVSALAQSVFDPTEPRKEYIYVGGRLVAVEVSGVSVAISPTAVTLGPQEQQQFTVTLHPLDNPAGTHTVTWGIDAPAQGTITQQGLYTPPENQSGTDVVRVTSNLDPTVSDTADVTFDTTGSGPVVVTIMPASGTALGPSQTQVFTVQENHGITYAWTTVPAGKGTFTNISGDTRTATSNSPGVIVNAETIQVKAEDAANANVFGTASVDLVPPPAVVGVDLQPTSLLGPSVAVQGGTVNLSFTLQNNGSESAGFIAYQLRLCTPVQVASLNACEATGCQSTPLASGSLPSLDPGSTPISHNNVPLGSPVTGEYSFAVTVDTVPNHYCPVKSRIESAGWGHRVSSLGNRAAARPVEWAFSRIA